VVQLSSPTGVIRHSGGPRVLPQDAQGHSAFFEKAFDGDL
jgi:hypothetical protein